MISVVDDDVLVRNATENLLMSLGYGVITFASAEEFLASGRAEDTSCVITDVQMPGLSGLDLQQCLVKDGHHLPIIFITAFPSEGVRKRALEAGAIGFLGKPIDEEILIECLDRALNRPALRNSES